MELFHTRMSRMDDSAVIYEHMKNKLEAADHKFNNHIEDDYTKITKRIDQIQKENLEVINCIGQAKNCKYKNLS